MCNTKKQANNKINEQIKPNKNKHVDTENKVGVSIGEGEMGKGESTVWRWMETKFLVVRTL